jgi:ankyrin repeat protein
MRLLTLEKKQLFVDKIMNLRQQLNAVKPEKILQSLELFENQLTLDEMQACFLNSKPDEINANLMSVLFSRWERVRHSNMCYTQQPGNLVNQLCFEIAKEIAPPASTIAEIDALEPNTGPYCLLMPSLENTVDVYGNNIHTLGLHEFVLSDNARVLIPLALCLHQAFVSATGQLRQIVAIDGDYPYLTLSEIERVSHHSIQAHEFYQAVVEYNQQRLLGDDIGAKLSQLVVALRNGGSHSGRGSGSELNAGSEANLGILAFYNYWVALPEPTRLAIFAETPILKTILGRLFRPDDVNYREVRFCVELIATALDPIIEKYNAKPTIRALEDRVSKQKGLFEAAVQEPNGLAIISKTISPKHILHHIFKLNIDAQKELFKFKHQGYENALMYALARRPDALIDFELEAESKLYAISVQVNDNHDSALIVAAKKGETNAIKLLLDWGAQIESHDLNKSTALHWAANNGHVDAVRCLLENGALLEAMGDEGNTTLNFAVIHGKGAVVELLLKKNASINVRGHNGKNALDIAIARHPEFVEPLLMQLATLPADEQAECLLDVPGGPYPNVLFYAAANKPALFDALVSNVLQQPTQASIRAICDASNEKGYTPLILAAQIGASESLHKLLAVGVEIESQDLNKSTALHWAANNGHVDAVTCLLEKGASLEARGDGGNTTLNFAVIHGKGAVVELLLKKNASINVRGQDGKNALDIAIARRPKFVKPLLMQLATLPADEQAKCLLNVPGGPYDDVYAYVAIERPAFFNSLILSSLKASNTSTTDITAILAKMHFDEHIEHIFAHYQRMKKKSLSNSKYIDAALAAKTLLIECGKARVALFQSDAVTEKKICLFKETCQRAIEKAKPVLEKHREWGKVIAAFLLSIIMPFILPNLYATGFLSVKTKSVQLLDKLHEAIDKPNPRGR